MKEQLTLSDLCGYLPYDLKCKTEYGIMELTSINSNTKFPFWFGYDGKFPSKQFNSKVLQNYGLRGHGFKVKEVKPIFRNLSTDLTREIIAELEILRVGHIDWITTEREGWIKKYGHSHWLDSIPYGIIKILQSHHFWLGDQSYFEKGIILDFNDVKL